MKKLQIKKLNIPAIIDIASRLRYTGRLANSQNNLAYLDIDDAYIHALFPLLQDQKIKIPDYFGVGSVGAHITVMYPEEGEQINVEDLNQEHHFLIRDLVAAEIGKKTYYVLLVESLSLLELRKKYGLPELLCFKGYSIGFHITIGVKF
jgi:hypothetical protein